MFLFGFLDALKALLYGIVEGITEWLPVSSTGHMIILDAWLKTESTYGSDFWSFFLVIIQLGAILAVIVTFIKKLWPFGKNKTAEEKKQVWKTWLYIIIACVPAAVIGLLLDDFLDEHLYNFITVAITLILYGILFIVLELINRKKEFKIHDLKEMTWKLALIIGLIQLLSLIPGTSRSGVTILGAMILGIDRATSAEFSFCLSIPVMVGASLLKGLKYFVAIGKGEAPAITSDQVWFLIIGIVSAFLVSLLAINLLLKFIRNHDFIPFGIYRIVLGVIIIILFATSVLKMSSNTNTSNAMAKVEEIITTQEI
ncbi:MAG: undecaprenyl-diphosphate phosphatase [Acholeplasmatales bacterium]|nr:undecaprenyl-diphosphate phosphatase [Acholeplasmatales bacterium]